MILIAHGEKKEANMKVYQNNKIIALKLHNIKIGIYKPSGERINFSTLYTNKVIVQLCTHKLTLSINLTITLFTTLHGMQMRSYDENSVHLSVRPSDA